MTRPQRNECPGAIHHVVAAGKRQASHRRGQPGSRLVPQPVRANLTRAWLAYPCGLLDGYAPSRCLGDCRTEPRARHEATPGRPRTMAQRPPRTRRERVQAALLVSAHRQREVVLPRMPLRHPQPCGGGALLASSRMAVVLLPPHCGGGSAEYLLGESRLLEMFGDAPREARQNYARLVDEMARVISAQRLHDGRDLWSLVDQVVASRVADRCPTEVGHLERNARVGAGFSQCPTSVGSRSPPRKPAARARCPTRGARRRRSRRGSRRRGLRPRSPASGSGRAPTLPPTAPRSAARRAPSRAAP